MLHRLTALLTIVVVLTCPLFCLGRIGAAEDSAVAACCCQHCRHRPDGEPANPAPDDGCATHCLCKGAVDSRPAVASFDALALCFEAAVDPAASVIAVGPEDAAAGLRTPVARSGRWICVEHCALRR